MKRLGTMWRGDSKSPGGLVFLCLLYILLVIPPLFRMIPASSEAYDEMGYHLPVIHSMAAQWPTPDIESYASATTPGWHLLMAGLYRWSEGDLAPLRFVNIIFGLLLIVTVYMGARRGTTPIGAAVLTMPLMCSRHVIDSAVWLTTDNTALLLAAASLYFSILCRPRFATAALSGVCAAATVFVRQTFIWVIAPIGLIAVLASRLRGFVPGVLHHSRLAPGGRLAVVAGLAAGVPALLIGGMFLLWGGFIPDHEGIRSHFEGAFSGATFAYALTIIGILGTPMLTVIWRNARPLRARDPYLWLALGAGLLTSVLFQTQWETRLRAYGWIWEGLKRIAPYMGGRIEYSGGAPVMVEAPFEIIGGRSPFLHVTATAGAFVLYVLWRACRARGTERGCAVLLLTMLGWVLAQGIVSVLGQRYYEPIILVFLPWLFALAIYREPEEEGSARAPWGRPADWLAWSGPMLVAAFQLALVAVTTYSEALFPD